MGHELRHLDIDGAVPESGMSKRVRMSRPEGGRLAPLEVMIGLVRWGGQGSQREKGAALEWPLLVSIKLGVARDAGQGVSGDVQTEVGLCEGFVCRVSF